MTTYLLSMINPTEGTPPDQDALAEIMAEIEKVNAEIRAADAWVFAGGLTAHSDARAVTRSGTEGPFSEATEHLGGLTILRHDDADTVMGWAQRLADITGLMVEVRPFVWA